MCFWTTNFLVADWSVEMRLKENCVSKYLSRFAHTCTDSQELSSDISDFFDSLVAVS